VGLFVWVFRRFCSDFDEIRMRFQVTVHGSETGRVFVLFYLPRFGNGPTGQIYEVTPRVAHEAGIANQKVGGSF